jgi:uncharacterized protein YjeT (DUF2065 family)
MSYIWTIALLALILLVGIYILLFPQNFKQKISERKNIEIRILGIYVIVFGLLFYTIYEAFRANYKLLMIADKGFTQSEHKADTSFIKSNTSITNDGNTSIYDINMPMNEANK